MLSSQRYYLYVNWYPYIDTITWWGLLVVFHSNDIELTLNRILGSQTEMFESGIQYSYPYDVYKTFRKKQI